MQDPAEGVAVQPAATLRAVLSRVLAAVPSSPPSVPSTSPVAPTSPVPSPFPVKIVDGSGFFDEAFWQTVVAVGGSLLVALIIWGLTTAAQSKFHDKDLKARTEAQKKALDDQMDTLRAEKSLDAIVELQRAVDTLYGALHEFREPRGGSARPDVRLAIRDFTRVLPIVSGQLTDAQVKSAVKHLGVAATNDAMWVCAAGKGIEVRNSGLAPDVERGSPSPLEAYMNKMIDFLAQRRANETAEPPSLQVYIGRAQTQAAAIDLFEYARGYSGQPVLAKKPEIYLNPPPDETEASEPE